MKYWKLFVKIFILYIIGSLFGFIVENIFEFLTQETFHIRQGLIYGPFIPVYGVGAVMFYLMFLITKKPSNVFIISVLLGGLVEFMASLFQEKVFGTVSWDYSGTFMNIGGRTNLAYCLCWGIIGLAFSYIAPYVDKLDILIEHKAFRIIGYILIVIMIFDITISCIASFRQTQRKMGVEPQSKVGNYLDVHYPDEVLDRVYNNKKWVTLDE